jgi:hypothetical protein
MTITFDDVPDALSKDDLTEPVLRVKDGDKRMQKTISDIEAGIPPSWQANWQGQPIDFNNKQEGLTFDDIPSAAKKEDKEEEPVNTKLAEKLALIESQPGWMKSIIGAGEIPLAMLSGIPHMVTKAGGILGTMAGSVASGTMPTAEELQTAGDESPITQAAAKIAYEPKTKTGQEYTSGLSKSLMSPFRGLPAAVQAALAGTGQTGAQQIYEDPTAVGPAVGEAVGTLAMTAGLVKGGMGKVKPKTKPPIVTEPSLQDIASDFSKTQRGNLATLNPVTGRWSEGQVPAELGPMPAEMASKVAAPTTVPEITKSPLLSAFQKKYGDAPAEMQGMPAPEVASQVPSLVERRTPGQPITRFRRSTDISPDVATAKLRHPEDFTDLAESQRRLQANRYDPTVEHRNAEVPGVVRGRRAADHLTDEQYKANISASVENWIKEHEASVNEALVDKGVTVEFIKGQHESMTDPTRNQLLDYAHENKPVELTGIVKTLQGEQVGHIELVKLDDGTLTVRDINTSKAGKGVGTALQQGMIDAGLPITPSEFVTEAGAKMQKRINYGPGGKQSGAIDPQVVAEAARKFASLAKDAAHFTDMLVEKYGEAIRPYAAMMYEKTKKEAAVNGGYTGPNLLQRMGTPISTLALNIHPEIGQRLLGMENSIKRTTSKRIQKVDELFTNINKSDKGVQGLLNDALLQNDFETIRNVTKNSPDVRAKFESLREVLNDVGAELKETGLVESLREDYFPRIVKDYKGLMERAGITESAGIAAKIAEARKNGATESEVSETINNELGFTKRSRKPGFAKERVFDEIPEEFMEFYASPTETIHTYLKNATERIEMAKLFGKNLTKTDGKVNLSASIGAYVNDMLARGKLSEDVLRNGGLDDLAELLQSRFSNKAMNPFMKDLQNVTTMATMGDVSNSMAQIGDISNTIVQANPINTLKAMLILLSKEKRGQFTRAKDLGLLDHVSEEFVGDRGTNKAVKRLFKLNGLSALDGYMKSVNLVANQLAAEARVGKENSRLYRVYKERFGDRFPQLLQNLRKGERTELTDELLFSELSKFQPISKSEFSLARLNNPNVAGAAMTLKSFMLKQIDNIITESYGEYKKGRPLQGAKNLIALIVVTGSINAIIQNLRDRLQNKVPTYEGEWDDVPQAFLKNFGLDGYFSDKALNGPSKAILEQMVPPYSWVDPIARDAFYGADKGLDKVYGNDVFRDNKKGSFAGKSIRAIPLFGDELYGWSEFGEQEKKEKEKKLHKETLKQKQVTNRLLKPFEKAYQEWIHK